MDEIKEETDKVFSIKRYYFIKEYSKKTLFPAPFAFIEYFARLFKVLVTFYNPEIFSDHNSFSNFFFLLDSLIC